MWTGHWIDRLEVSRGKVGRECRRYRWGVCTGQGIDGEPRQGKEQVGSADRARER